MEEIWKPIIGYEDHYEVSNQGRVRRIKSGSGTQIERILKGTLDFYGYLSVGLTADRNQKQFPVHRLVCSAFHENPENKPCVNHIDGNKTNNCAENLEWCTQKENIAHAWRTGLCKVTEEYRRKLSESHKGHEVSEETRKKMSEAQRRRWQKQEEVTA